jgi:hypothetical protein
MVKAMLYKPCVVVWAALLGARRTRGNVEMEEQVVK